MAFDMKRAVWWGRYRRYHPWIKSGLPVAFLSLCVLIYAIAEIWWTARSDHSQAQIELATERKRWVEITRIAQRAAAYRHAQAALLQAQARLRPAGGGGQVAWLGALDDLARQTSVLIQSESFDTAEQRQGIDVMPLTITLQGRYENIRAWLTGLDKVPAWIALQEAVLSGTTDIDAPLRMQLRLWVMQVKF